MSITDERLEMTNPYGQPNPYAQQQQYNYGGPVVGPGTPTGYPPNQQPTQPAAPNPFTQYPTVQQQPAAPAAPEQQWQPQPSAPPANPDTSSFFGGGDGSFFSFKSDAMMNRWVGGQIVSKRMSPMTDDDGKPQTWPDGNTKYRLIVTCQTGIQTDSDDDGKRSLDVKSFAVKAVAEALREVGANDVEPLGWLYMAWVGNDSTKGKKGNPAKVWRAVYRPPGHPDPMAGQPVNQLPHAAPAAQQPQPMPHQYASVDPAVATAQQQAWAAAQQTGYPAPGPLAAQPAQAMQQAHQLAQQDPAIAAAAGYPPPGQAFTQAAAPEIAAMQQAQAAQFAAAGYPDPNAQQQPAAPQFSPYGQQQPQSPGVAPAGFNPFGTGAPQQ